MNIRRPQQPSGRLGIASFVGAAILSALAMTTVFFVAPREAGGAVPDCATAPNVRDWDGGAGTQNWSDRNNWEGDVLPGANEIACIYDFTVIFDIPAEVDAVVSGPDGTLSMPIAWTLTLSPSAGEESQVANLGGSAMRIAGAGDMIVTTSFNSSAPGLAGPSGSTLTLLPSVAANANVGSLRVDGRTFVVSNGVTVTQSANTHVVSENGGSIENSGIWNAGDGSVFSPSGSAPGIFRNTATGEVRKTGGTGSTRLHTFENDGLIENETTGTITLGGGAGTSDGDLVTGAGMIETENGTYAFAGSVSGAGTFRLIGTATFSGSYAVARTVVASGRIVFDTPSPQTLPHLVAGGQTVAGSADLVVTETFDCNGCRPTGAAGSKLTLAASVGSNASAGSVFPNGRSVVVEQGVTVSHAGITNSSNGGSIENHGTWNTTGTLNMSAPSVFRNTATGILRRTAAAGAGNTEVTPRVENDGLIENLSTGTLKLGGGPDAPGKISIGTALNPDTPNTLANATLSGSGRLSPDVVQGEAIVAPGSSPGTIEVGGAPGGWQMLEVGNHSRLAIELGGTGLGEFDKLALAGPFRLPAQRSTLALSILPEYSPVPGDEFAIVEASSVTGRFATVTGTDIGNGLTLEVTYEADRIVVTVAGTVVNQRPDAVDDVTTVAEDSGDAAIDVLANDTDPEGDQLTITSVTQPANGTVAITGGGSGLTYRPNADFNGENSFTYRAADASGNSDTATVTVTVTPVNDPPDARDDTATVAEDSVATAIDVRANDTAAPDSGETLTITSNGQPDNGGASCTATSCSYTPASDFNGADSFTYTISDGNGGSDTATVNVTVSSGNDPPDALDDAATVAEDSGATAIDVLANDTAAPDSGETLTITSNGQPDNGGAASCTATSCSYTPASDFNGADSFTYTISDGNGGSDTATVRVTVTPVNDPPDAANDSATLAEDSEPTAIEVLANDLMAPDSGETLTVSAVTQPANGTVAIVDGGARVTYRPHPNFNGADPFGYTVSDGNGGSDTATVDVTVTPVNDPPEAFDDTATVVEDSTDNPINVLANDRDTFDGDEVTITSANPNAGNGTATCSSTSCSYTPDPGFDGEDSFIYRISDGHGGVDDATVRISVTPFVGTEIVFSSSRTGAGDIYVTNADGRGQTRLTTDVLPDTAPSWSPDRQRIAFEGVVSANNDVFRMNADGTGRLRLTAEPSVERQPTWSPDGARIAFESSRTGAGDIYSMTATGTDVRRLTESASLDTEPAWSPNHTIAYKSMQSGGGDIWVMKEDGTFETRLTTDPGEDGSPAWSPDGTKIAFQSTRGGNTDIWVMNADGSGEARLTTDPGADGNPTWSPDGTKLAFQSTRGGNTDIWVMNADGSGQTRTTTDPAADTQPSWSTPLPLPNRAPDAADDTHVVAESSGATAIGVLGNDNDPDADTLTITTVTQGDHGAVAITGGGTGLSYDPDQRYIGPDSFTYTISDGNGHSDTATVDVTVEGRIAFTRDGNVYLLAVGALTTQVTQLTTAGGKDPSWSPSRTKIAFERGGDIWIMNDDGTGQMRLTTHQAFDGLPAWSPDGERIAFRSDRGNNTDIWVVNANGSGQTRLTTHQSFDSDPTWSPDGTKIAFVSFRDGTYEIYSMHAEDGSQQTRLTNDSFQDGSPAWSPDGTRIAFESFRFGPARIWVINADGTGFAEDVPFDGAFNPSWSPDGTRVAFVTFESPQGNNGEIWSIEVDGFAPRQLTFGSFADRAPAWFTPAPPPPNGAPDAVDDSATVVKNSGPTPIAVLANDTDPEGDPLTIATVTQGAHGAVAVAGGGTGLTYDPHQGYTGPDTFRYTVSDGHGGTDTATVTVTVALPVGTEIVFRSLRTGNLGGDLFIINADGTGETQLTTLGGNSPAWSPDRTRIAFTSRRSDFGSGDIWVMNADGSGQTRLTTTTGVLETSPAWSPDGTRIAFDSDQAGGRDIYVMNADGSGQTRLTTDPAFDAGPSWSPDGTRIAFQSNRTGGGDVYVMNADGSGQAPLTTNPSLDYQPSWAPGGTRIAFTSTRTGSGDVYVMNADGSGQTRLTTKNKFDGDPSWSPEGARLAFTSVHGADDDVFVMNADGSAQARVTTHPESDRTPAWSTPALVP